MNKKDLYWIIASSVLFPLFTAAGTLMVVMSKSNRLTAFGWFLILAGAFFLILLLLRIPAIISAKKERNMRLKQKREEEKAFFDALASFERNECPEKNTVKLKDNEMVFFAEGRYVCEKNFLNKDGYHFAFEINGAKLKYKPEDNDDVCYLEESGILIEAGYFEGTALDDSENDNGIILKDTPKNSVGQTIILKPNEGYNLYIWTAEGDEIDYGFLKILKCENDVLTVYFSLNVLAGLCDTVEGTVELKKDTEENTADIHSLIGKIKRRPYNTIEFSAEEIDAIFKANKFLPESYLTFLKEIGSADLDWIDVGRNADCESNLFKPEEENYVKELLSPYPELDVKDFYFFAADESDSYYAFSRKEGDKKVYVFSNDSPNLTHYESFEEFLNEILNIR